MEWISLDDEKPENGEVIAYAPNGRNQYKDIVQQCTHVEGVFRYGYYNSDLNGVTHWMPLPEPPIEGK